MNLRFLLWNALPDEAFVRRKRPLLPTLRIMLDWMACSRFDCPPKLAMFDIVWAAEFLAAFVAIRAALTPAFFAALNTFPATNLVANADACHARLAVASPLLFEVFKL